jgi:lysophospholipase L1-like esterase
MFDKLMKAIPAFALISFLLGNSFSATIKIVFDGTSLLSGFTLGASNSMPAQLARTLPTNYTIWNYSVGGQTGADMLSDFDQQIAPLGPTSDAIVFDMGTNDLAIEGADVETVKARYIEYRARCVAAGFRWIFIRPLSPRAGDSLTFSETNRVTINQWLMATYPTNVYDPASEPRIFGPWGGYTRWFMDDQGVGHWGNEWFLDSVHLNLTGLPLDAAALRRKMVAEGFLKFEPPIVGVHFAPAVTISGAIGNQYRIDASDALSDWHEVARVTLTQSEQTWFDPSSASGQFYRAVEIQ